MILKPIFPNFSFNFFRNKVYFIREVPGVDPLKKKGSYLHIGMQRIADELFQKEPHLWAGGQEVHLKMDIHIDGVSVTDSSDKTAWTILGKFPTLDLRPFLLGCYLGSCEPGSFNLLLCDLVDDLLTGCREGILNWF